jgi:hypothetical protein
VNVSRRARCEGPDDEAASQVPQQYRLAQALGEYSTNTRRKNCQDKVQNKLELCQKPDLRTSCDGILQNCSAVVAALCRNVVREGGARRLSLILLGVCR